MLLAIAAKSCAYIGFEKIDNDMIISDLRTPLSNIENTVLANEQLELTMRQSIYTKYDRLKIVNFYA